MTPETVARIGRSWIGTPFYPHMAKKGIGADCVHLALEIYKEAGVLPKDLELPEYSLDGGAHLVDSLVVQWLARSDLFEIVSRHPEQGELITLKVGKVVHHVGIMVSSSTFVQSIRNAGVVERDLRDPTWSNRLRGCWKPTKLCLEAQTI